MEEKIVYTYHLELLKALIRLKVTGHYEGFLVKGDRIKIVEKSNVSKRTLERLLGNEKNKPNYSTRDKWCKFLDENYSWEKFIDEYPTQFYETKSFDDLPKPTREKIKLVIYELLKDYEGYEDFINKIKKPPKKIEKAKSKNIQTKKQKSYWKRLYALHRKQPAYWLVSASLLFVISLGATKLIHAFTKDKIAAIKDSIKELPDDQKKELIAAFMKDFKKGHSINDLLQRQVDSLLQLGKYDEVEELIKIGKQHEIASNEADASSYFELGVIKTLQLRYNEAMPLIEKSIELSPDNILYINSIGELYLFMGKNKQAVSYLQKGLELTEKLYPGDDSDAAASYSVLGMAWMQLHDYKKSNDFLQRALDIELKIIPDDSLELSQSYKNLGFSLCSSGDFYFGVQAFKKAFDLHQDQNDQYSADLNIDLGGIWQAVHNYKNAIFYTQCAIGIESKLSGTVAELTLATCYNNLGGMWQDSGVFQNSIQCYEKSLDYFDKINGGNPTPEKARTYHNLGGSWLNLNNYQKAADYFEKAADNYTSLYGENCVENIKEYDVLAGSYYKLDKYSKARDYIQKAVKISMDSLGPNDATTKETESEEQLLLSRIGN